MTGVPYDRANPSARYRELNALYRRLHVEGERNLDLPPEKTFAGDVLPYHATRIKRLIDGTGASSILDYGSGKGKQYESAFVTVDGRRFDCIQDYWDVDFVQCYDPSYAPFSVLPDGTFGGVVCTDVLEHCPEEDMSWIVEEMFARAERFVFANVACYPARKHLPNGENAHCTIKPPQWWRDLVRGISARHPGVEWEIWIRTREDLPGGPTYVETRLGSEEQPA